MSESPSQPDSKLLPPPLAQPEFIAAEQLVNVAADAIVVGLCDDAPLSETVTALDQSLGGVISALVECGKLSADFGDLMTLAGPGAKGEGPVLITVIGLGAQAERDRDAAFRAASTAVRSLVSHPIESLSIALAECFEPSQADAVVAGALFALEAQSIYRTKPTVHVPKTIKISGASDQAITQGGVLGESINLTRRLINEPAAMIYPQSLADRAETMAGQVGLECEIWDEERLESENCNAILAVGAGSERPPRLLILKHNGGPSGEAPIALVGKGVTFDSGGLSIKPSDGMVDMKCDMGGAATVIGAMHGIAKLGLKKNVIGLCGMAENMVSGNSYKLGDVIRTRSGKTIEILNTDAEGRVVLSDTLDVAIGHKPSMMVDLATLTGACMVALGNEVAGLMTNSQPTCEKVVSAADAEGEPVWQLPMFDLYNDKVKSKVADIKNIGEGRWGGAITAAKFLENFVGDTPWVHIDIAGPAFADSPKPHRDAGATGVMVRTLIRMIQNESE